MEGICEIDDLDVYRTFTAAEAVKLSVVIIPSSCVPRVRLEDRLELTP